MSAHTTGAHATPADHVPHVLPLKVYLGVFAMLIVFTGLTVAVSYIDLGSTINLTIALAVAGAKALMVMLIFMHLAFDKKFNSIIFASSIIFLVTLIAFTMADTETRGKYGVGFISGDRNVNPATPFEPGVLRSEQELIKRWTPKEEAPATNTTPSN